MWGAIIKNFDPTVQPTAAQIQVRPRLGGGLEQGNCIADVKKTVGRLRRRLGTSIACMQPRLIHLENGIGT